MAMDAALGMIPWALKCTGFAMAIAAELTRRPIVAAEADPVRCNEMYIGSSGVFARGENSSDMTMGFPTRRCK